MAAIRAARGRYDARYAGSAEFRAVLDKSLCTLHSESHRRRSLSRIVTGDVRSFR